MEHFSSNGCLVLQHIILFSMLRADPKSDILCAIWESTLEEIAQCYPYVTDRCFQKLLSSNWYIKGMIWNTLAPMAAFPCDASSYFCAETVPQIWHFVCNLRVNLGRNYAMWPISGWQILSEAPPIYLIYERKDMKHFRSNECFSL